MAKYEQVLSWSLKCSFSFHHHYFSEFKHLFLGINTVPFLCFQGELGEDGGFGFVRDLCSLPGPGPRYVCVVKMPPVCECCRGKTTSVAFDRKLKCHVVMLNSFMNAFSICLGHGYFVIFYF